MKYWSIRQY